MTVKKLLGNQPSQVSRNRDLGTLAFQNSDGAFVENLGGYLDGRIGINGLTRPDIRPSFICDFVGTKKLNGKMRFERYSRAMYYDGSPPVMAENNFLWYSQDFNYMQGTNNNENKEGHWRWGRNGLNDFGSGSVADATTAPDGTTTADLITENTANTYHQIWQLGYGHTDYWPYLTESIYCFSVYVKSYSADRFVKILIASDYIRFVYIVVNPANGAIVQPYNQSYSIDNNTVVLNGGVTSVGSGWYRVWIAMQGHWENVTIDLLNNTTGSGPFSWSTADYYGRHRYTGNGTSGVYLWGAQVEMGVTTPRAYNYTFDQKVLNWQPILKTADPHQHRIDHNPITMECKGLLMEREVTNNLRESQAFHKTPWTKTNCSIVEPYTGRLLISGTTMNPDGSFSHNYLQEDSTASAAHGISQTVSSGVNDGYSQVLSVYAKAKERTFIRLSTVCTRQTCNVWFDLVNGKVGTETVTVSSTTYNNQQLRYRTEIIPVGNGWYRCSLLFFNSGGTSITVSINLATGDNISTYTGGSAAGVYIWGAQCEQMGNGNYNYEAPLASSYIPTSYRRQARSQEYCYIRGLDTPERGNWLNQQEGTLLIEASNFNDYYGDMLCLSNTRADTMLYDGGTYFRFRKYANDYELNVGGQEHYWDGRALTSAPGSIYSNHPDLRYANFNKIFKAGFSFKTNDVSFTVNGEQPTNIKKWESKARFNFISIGSLYKWETLCGNGYIRKFIYYSKKITDNELAALTSVDYRD